MGPIFFKAPIPPTTGQAAYKRERMETGACQAPLSMGFSRQEYWSGLPCPPPGDLPNPGIELTSPALQVDSLPLSHQGCCCCC